MIRGPPPGRFTRQAFLPTKNVSLASSLYRSKNRVNCARLKPTARAMLVPSGFRMDSSGCLVREPRSHSFPAILLSCLKRCLTPSFSAYSYASRRMSTVESPYNILSITFIFSTRVSSCSRGRSVSYRPNLRLPGFQLFRRGDVSGFYPGCCILRSHCAEIFPLLAQLMLLEAFHSHKFPDERSLAEAFLKLGQ